jgi:hypothetical protein
MEEVEWVFVMPEQCTAEEVGVNYNIGDLVNVKYCHVEKEQLTFRQHMGIITDYGGDIDDRLQRSYKVLTVDGKHDWSPRGDLMILQRVKPNNIK